jgi:hypothetical protein
MTIFNYYGRGNSANANAVQLCNGDTIYFSYQTKIGYYLSSKNVLYLSENCWSNTTGRHISAVRNDVSSFTKIVDKIPRDKFDRITDYMIYK